MKAWLARLRLDAYIALILAMVVLGSLAPVRGEAAAMLGLAVKWSIALVFFLHGARLSTETVLAGMAHWRLHLSILAVTFGVFPLVGVGLTWLPDWITPTALAGGLVYLACLPSTIQSAIGFTVISKGNVAAAVCSATASNLLGVLITPLLVGLLLHASGQPVTGAQVQAVVLQLLVPFIAGQLLHRWLGPWTKRHAKPLGYIDRGSILLVVYNAFSGAVVAGLWKQVSPLDLVRLAVLICLMLAGSIGLMLFLSRRMGFAPEDEAVMVFGGSNKSLASGAPMAQILFPAATAGFALLPLMIYHQLQLIVCAAIAQRYAKRAEAQ